MSDDTKRKIISSLIGLGTGLFMSILVLYMLITNFFTIASFSFVLIVLAGCAAPLCLSFLRKTEWNIFLSQCVMIVTSFVITLLYGMYVNSALAVYGFSSIFLQVLSSSAIVHGLSFVTTVLSELYYRHAGRK